MSLHYNSHPQWYRLLDSSVLKCVCSFMHKLLLLLGFLHVHFPAVFFVSVNKVIPGETPLDVKLHVSETQRMATKKQLQ